MNKINFKVFANKDFNLEHYFSPQISSDDSWRKQFGNRIRYSHRSAVQCTHNDVFIILWKVHTENWGRLVGTYVTAKICQKLDSQSPSTQGVYWWVEVKNRFQDFFPEFTGSGMTCYRIDIYLPTLKLLAHYSSIFSFFKIIFGRVNIEISTSISNRPDQSSS